MVCGYGSVVPEAISEKLRKYLRLSRNVLLEIGTKECDFLVPGIVRES